MIETSLLHIGVTCKNPAVFENFYSKYFGFKRIKTIIGSNTREIVFIKDSNNLCLEIFQSEENSPIEMPNEDGCHYPGWRHIAFSVANIDKKLEEMGTDAIITLGPKTLNDKGWRVVWIKDPEGNIIELSQGYED
jgi:glyoxylase I family protein